MNRCRKMLVVYLLLSVPLWPNNASGSPVLHRAVDPARISLDINISAGLVQVFYRISQPSIAVLSADGTANSLRTLLASSRELVYIPDLDGCNTSTFRIQLTTDNDLSGYQIIDCSSSGRISTLELNLYRILPRLQEVDLWLISEQWQTRRLVGRSQPVVSIPGGG